MRQLTAALLLIVGAAVAGPARGADELPTGNWKVLLPIQGDPDKPLWLIQLEQTEGKLSGKVLANAPDVPGGTLDNVKVTQGKLTFDLKLGAVSIRFVGELPEKAGEKILGSVQIRGRVGPAELLPTRLSTLDSFALNKERLEKGEKGVEMARLAMNLLSQAEDNKATVEEVRGWADRAVSSAEPYGLWYRDVVVAVADALSGQKPYADVAVQYARQAERLIEDSDPPSFKKRVLSVLAMSLEQAGKADEATEVRERNNKISYISIKPFEGRKAKSDRAVLVELFTGAQCPPCVAADLAFDALQKSFKPSEVVLLQYHLHIPGPDPLTNPATEARARFYGRAVPGTPSIFFNGKPAAEGGGSFDNAQEKYTQYLDVITPLLEQAPKAALTVEATRKGDQIDIKADVNELAETGPDVRLRLVLIEETVTYVGGNRLPEHHCVVRSFPGGVEGLALKEKKASQTATVKLDELRKQLEEYLTKANEEDPFPTRDRPLELKSLRVAAFVQNDETGEVLQAVQSEIKGE